MKIYLLPFARFTMMSPKSPDAVALLLLRAVPVEGKSKRRDNNLTEYFGSVFQNDFIIERNLNYDNSLYPWIVRINAFTPIFQSKIEPIDGRTKITVNAFLGPMVTIVLIVWYVVLMTITLFYLRDAISGGGVEFDTLSFAFLAFAIAFTWSTISFNYEVMKTKEFLKKAIRSEEIT